MRRDYRQYPLTIVLIRHGSTPSNEARRYLGRRDEPLSPAGAEQAHALSRQGVPAADIVFSSPLSRCRQTAHIVYPKQSSILVPQFAELDFGRFEGRTHDQLINEEPAYQAWLDSGGVSEIPDGETLAQMCERCREGWRIMLGKAAAADTVAAVVHSGTIMVLVSQLARPTRKLYDCFVRPCGTVIAIWDGEALTLTGGDLQ